MKKQIFLLAVCGALLLGTGGCSVGYTYDDASLYTPGDGSADPAAVRTVEIDWPAGSVTLCPYEGELLQFSDNSPYPSDDNLLHSYLDGDILRIRFCKSGILQQSATEPKDLEVLVPASHMEYLQEISIDTASAAVFVNDLQVQTLKIDTASGEVTVDGSAESVAIDTASGNIALSGTFHEIETDTVSGALTAICTACPQRFTGDSTSGAFQVTLPADSSFTLEYDSVSGELISDFPLQEREGGYTAGDGAFPLSFDTVSGDLHLTKR